jgi:protein-S-isoprenylcysteine O-methyltransferase Ste14
MNTLFTCAIVYFLIAVSVYRIKSTLITTGNAKGQVSHAWTLYILSILHMLIGIVAIAEYFWSVKYINYLIASIGLASFTIGVIGRFWALNTLGKYHSPQIEIREDQPLITSGPYRYMRHPIYFFTIFEVIGCALIPNAFFAFLIATFMYTPLLLYRLVLEEKTLTQTFGLAYVQYKAAVPCLIPFTKWTSDSLQSTKRVE